jgi:hypothetical protein
MQKLITTAKFAEEQAVSETTVRQAIKTGRLRIYDAAGKLLPAETKGRKYLKPSEARRQWEENRCKERQSRGGATLPAARARKAAADAALRELQLRIKQGEFIPAEGARMAARAIGFAIQRIAAGITGWADEISGAHARGGVRAVTACLKVKSVELAAAMSGALIAEANELGGGAAADAERGT